MKNKTFQHDTFKALMDRIKSAGHDRDKLDICEQQIERHYKWDTINARQFEKLDLAIFERYAVGTSLGIQ